MTDTDLPFDVSRQLAALKHEKKNHDLLRLPPNMTIQRRALNHPPIASPLVGAAIQKVVYVSRKTPIMSAVKRVKKLLHHIEKRATLKVELVKKGDKAGLKELADARDELVKNGEEVLVKASGRAMEQALRVGEWFRTKEKEVLCSVEVRTGSVSVVDDIVEVEKDGQQAKTSSKEEHLEDTTLEEGDTTMELLASTSENKSALANDQENGTALGQEKAEEKGRPRKRKRRPMYDADDVPEARLRWIKTIEIAISLKA